jgi:cell division inhibitor SulA/protein ImuA
MSAPALIAHDPAVRLDSLVWRGDRLAAPAAPGLPTGHPPLDAVLPGGGWPRGALTELLLPHPGVGELGLLLPLLARVGPRRWAVCIAPPEPLYAPALAAAGVPLERLLLVEAASPAHARWAARQALASGSADVVLLWLADADMGALRRLQLAAEENSTPLVLLRPDSLARQPSPAALRLALTARPGGVEVRILKRRGPPLTDSIAIDLPGLAAAGLQSSRPRSTPVLLSPRPGSRSSLASVHALVRPLPSRPGPAGIHPGAQ